MVKRGSRGENKKTMYQEEVAQRVGMAEGFWDWKKDGLLHTAFCSI